MRKITKESVNAFLSGREYKGGNMRVSNLTLMGKAVTNNMYLHGNLIATINPEKTKMLISNRGWFTATTKERLNALPNVRIVQKNWDWYLNGKKWDGKTIEINL